MSYEYELDAIKMEFSISELRRIYRWFSMAQLSGDFDEQEDWEIIDKIYVEIRKREKKGE